MRGTVAKRIRREVYGDMAHRDTRYTLRFGKKKRPAEIRVKGLRRKYQRAKKDYQRRRAA